MSMGKITEKEMLDWLERLREAYDAALRAEYPDGEENHPEHSDIAQDMRVIVAITERLREMTAVEYLQARNEMCKKVDGNCQKCAFARKEEHHEETGTSRV